ncbi:MAG: hypothetical protein KBG28_07235 [Kofleriaceae bacterium]|jgi:hypothetical protein|nr:hypothetical protein [Kofleriaceae bacterium]
MRLVVLALFPLLVTITACGDPPPTSQPDAGADADTGLCAGRPCRTRIATEADWAAVSVPHPADERCDFVEEAKFIAPATAAAALQEVVFQDLEAHRLHLDFMTQVLPEYFGGLSGQAYAALVQRRATRQYYAGALYRLTDAAGATTGYGFDVVVDPSWDEQLTEAEVSALGARLSQAFTLPLRYAPTTPDALVAAQQFQQPITHFPRSCTLTTCPDPATDCIVVPAAVSLCGHFSEGRTIALEYAAKTRLDLAAATLSFPRVDGTYPVPPLFTGGARGPGQAPITPVVGSAEVEVRAYPANNYVDRTYRQRLQIGAVTHELAWSLYLPAEGGGLLVAEPHLTGVPAAVMAPLGNTSNDEVALLSACAPRHQRWQVRGDIGDGAGGGFTIDVQYQPPAAGSGPLFPTAAEVRLGGQTATVSDYFRLVYAGEHHNWNNQYWVLFATPLTYAGHAVHGLWIDEEPFSSSLEQARTLDAARQPLEVLPVTGYEFAFVPGG